MRFQIYFSYISAIFLVLVSCSNSETKYFIKGKALGTTYNVNYYSKDKQTFKPQFDSIFRVINHSLSTYLPNSDISKLNNGENIEVDEHFIKVFQASKQIYKNTEGYFDPSIGIMVNAYGFGPITYDLSITNKSIDSLMNFVGFDNFNLNKNHLDTKLGSFFLDFNAIAKGYTVDVLADFLKQQNIQNYFVEIGGEIVAKGHDLDYNKIWNFGIETPSESNTSRALSYAITLENKALATSGNYRKFKTDPATGQKFVHTINPQTGLSKKSNVLSASVTAHDCMTADAYATAFMAMGYNKARQIINKHKINALIIYVDNNNKIQTYISQNIKNVVSEL